MGSLAVGKLPEIMQCAGCLVFREQEEMCIGLAAGRCDMLPEEFVGMAAIVMAMAIERDVDMAGRLAREFRRVFELTGVKHGKCA